MKMASDAQKFAKFRQFFVNFSVQKIFIFLSGRACLAWGGSRDFQSALRAVHRQDMITHSYRKGLLVGNQCAVYLRCAVHAGK